METHRTPVPRWVAYLFAVLAIALAPSIARVVVVAPPLLLAAHWRLAWGGFDVGLAVMLAATGLSVRRCSVLAGLLAAATAALLACDAWMDILSSAGKSTDSLLSAAAEAAVVEIPLMGILIWVASSTAHRPAAGSPPPWPRWLAGTFIALAAALVPWIVWLFLTLPNAVIAHNWDVTRAGFIIALTALLATSAAAFFRHWRAAPLLSAMTAALLVRSAWFNTLTSRPSHASLAFALALVLELPLAALCVWVAVRQARERPNPAVRTQVLTAVPPRPDARAGQDFPAAHSPISDRPAC